MDGNTNNITIPAMTTTPAHTASAQAMATDYVQMEDGSGHGYVSCVGDGNGKMHDGALPPGRQQQTLQPGGLVHFDSAALDRARDEAHRHAGINGTVGLEAGTTCADDDNRLGDDDEQDTLHADPSIFSSVVTADGISDPVGFHIVCLVGLIGDMGRGCMFPTLWPLVQSIGGNSMTLGHAVAAFSFGRILMSPVLGSWSHRYGYTQTLALSLVIVLLGTLLYAQVVNVHVGQPEALLMLAQLVLGLGSGTLSWIGVDDKKVNVSYVIGRKFTKSSTTCATFLSIKRNSPPTPPERKLLRADSAA